MPPTRATTLLLAVVIAFPTFPAFTEETRQTPAHDADTTGLNHRFLDPDLNTKEWVERWESESREIYTSRMAIVEALQLSSGMHVADVGAGTGLFIEPLAEKVTEKGRVFARDISPKFIDHINQRVTSAGFEHVDAQVSRTDDALLPANGIDVVLLCDTYHHFDQPDKMLQSLSRALRAGGRLVVIDFERIPGKSREWILGHVRAGKKQVIDEIERAGFTFVDEVTIGGLQENYLIRFQKRRDDHSRRQRLTPPRRSD